MSSSPFYAYAINRQNECCSRLLLIFANRAVADEWWRQISRDPILNNIRRFTPQFYSYDNSVVQLSQFFHHHKDIADKFIDRMLIQPENDMNGARGITTVPSVNITDHVSGNWFHIRLKADPQLYWYHNKETNWILLSNNHTERTAFCITALEEPEGTIMVGKDKITIAASEVDITIHVSGGIKYLGTGSGGTVGAFTFQDFAQGKFLVVKSYLMHNPKNRAQQDVWELVCSHNAPV